MKWALPHRTRRHEHSGAQNHTKSHLPCRFGRSTPTYLIWTGLHLLVISAFRSAPLRSGFACWADQICGEVHATLFSFNRQRRIAQPPGRLALATPVRFSSPMLLPFLTSVLWGPVTTLGLNQNSWNAPCCAIQGIKKKCEANMTCDKQSLGGFGAILVILRVENPWFPKWGLL